MSNEYVIGNAEDDRPMGGSRGWFIGHFLGPEAGLRRNSAVEVKWGIHRQGEGKPSRGTNLNSATLTLLVSGCFVVSFPALGKEVTLQRPGDYVLFAPGVKHDWMARTASIVVTVRWPSIPQGTATSGKVRGETAEIAAGGPGKRGKA